jgi:HAD superfamily hydrolase (TIGR01458 family)
VDAVVLGDIGDGWNHALLQRIFDEVMAGAALVALHRGRFWQLDGGLALDIGVYVAGLEYVTGRQATVCGKPAPAFFQAGLDALELPAAQVAMVGDDIVSDIGGAQACGLTGVLVRTGKFREEQLTRAGVTPDLVVADVTALA